jgi:hypothetical protein
MPAARSARLSTVIAFHNRSRGAAGERCGKSKRLAIIAQVTSSLGDERLPLARPGSFPQRGQRPYLDFVGGTGEDRIEYTAVVPPRETYPL